MPVEVQIVEVTPQLIAGTKRHTTRIQIGTDIGAGFGSVMAALGQEGVSAIGPPFVVYHRWSEDDEGDIEMGVPVKSMIAGNTDVVARELEGGTMATVAYKGPYEGLSKVYEEMQSWITENGHEIVGPPREIYLNDPQVVPPEELLTRLEFPIKTDG